MDRTRATGCVDDVEVRSFPGIKMSTPEVEGGQYYDDILGFSGDGFKDEDDTDPPEKKYQETQEKFSGSSR
jgi:hypothetical protein